MILVPMGTDPTIATLFSGGEPTCCHWRETLVVRTRTVVYFCSAPSRSVDLASLHRHHRRNCPATAMAVAASGCFHFGNPPHRFDSPHGREFEFDWRWRCTSTDNCVVNLHLTWYGKSAKTWPIGWSPIFCCTASVNFLKE